MQFKGNSALDLEPIQDNDFKLAYYPDIGMTDESIWLSNLRVAPIQATSYGHPASTHCPEVDYFIVGANSEDLDKVSEYYSERVIVLPGDGVQPMVPVYQRKNPSKDTDKIVINCPWGPDKHTYVLYKSLQKIYLKSDRGCKFSIFPSRNVSRYNAGIPFTEEVAVLLGQDAKVHKDKEYYDYMEEMEKGDITLNSWPFGGYNTVIESLYLGKPVVTFEGDRFYNKVASELLRKAGLSDLIARTVEEYEAIATRLITDKDFLAEKKAILAELDFETVFCNDTLSKNFEKAVRCLLANHEDWKNEPRTNPIFIEE